VAHGTGPAELDPKLVNARDIFESIGSNAVVAVEQGTTFVRGDRLATSSRSCPASTRSSFTPGLRETRLGGGQATIREFARGARQVTLPAADRSTGATGFDPEEDEAAGGGPGVSTRKQTTTRGATTRLK
jgi:hypothetical protein